MSIRATHLEQFLEDDALMDAAAARLIDPDPDAPPAVNKARLRFTAGEVRQCVRAVAEAMAAR